MLFSGSLDQPRHRKKFSPLDSDQPVRSHSDENKPIPLLHLVKKKKKRKLPTLTPSVRLSRSGGGQGDGASAGGAPGGSSSSSSPHLPPHPLLPRAATLLCKVLAGCVGAPRPGLRRSTIHGPRRFPSPATTPRERAPLVAAAPTLVSSDAASSCRTAFVLVLHETLASCPLSPCHRSLRRPLPSSALDFIFLLRPRLPQAVHPVPTMPRAI